MFVIKRDGREEEVYFDKITSRIKKLCYGLSDNVDPVIVSQKVCQGVFSGVTTEQLDLLAARTCAHLVTHHFDYGTLAARIEVSNLHKKTCKNFYETMKALRTKNRISKECMSITEKYSTELSSAIIYERDFEYDYFGFKTLERAYLLKIGDEIVERPQQMLMRVSIGIHGDDLNSILATYTDMSLKLMTHASPTLFNAGTPIPQMSSCFLLQIEEDSLDGIYNTLHNCARISKSAGGIGLAIHKVRAKGTRIGGTNGKSDGLVPMLKNFNDTARYINQGGRRPGAFAMYVEPWHADIFEFLDLRKNHGKEEMRARDLFYALWVNDLFMERVEKNELWSLMCPKKCPGLHELWGDKFKALYTKYEDEKMYNVQIPARKLWKHITDSQKETGTPYMVYKDSVNRKSNHQHLGTIQSSNLCVEICEYTAPDEIAVCNLCSLALNKFVDGKNYDFDGLYKITESATRNLNKIIDRNFYPTIEAKNSNMRHRPIGIGVQGLADTFMMLGYPFDSKEAKQLNKDIFETIYFASLSTSCTIAKEDGTYPSYEGSPVSRGILQHDMWDVEGSSRWDWDSLRLNISEHGVRNSLLVALMPTASTSQILGNIECFEPLNSNVYVRRTHAGEFTIINKYLIQDLIERKMWNTTMREELIRSRGSIQKIPNIPSDMKLLYRTVWEIPLQQQLRMSADRGVFVDQSQSLNIHMESPSTGSLSSMHFAGWKLGLKTGMYYLRSKAAANPIAFTVSKKKVEEEECLSCGA